MTGRLTVKYINGDKDDFEFKPVGSSSDWARIRLREILDSNRIVLQLEGEIEVIPFANVQSISVVPAKEEILEVKISEAQVAKRIC